ncbi:MAG TPA: bifunctional 2-C-methyl-D-erythritol 4-phosphate cytidylyltransferase/2-C-methyl-D-erythritol 2,4-cyclodiphosphate synthase [Dehalococcoidia bacterium]|nr:bifunctional 2-C-methyl-D-erythritol 4-phosphate cytidylyltransferase/2-C-methyl-D-erythritol 2,4-cyclodiphosphate synthase [Dehalococcoidia bacterium]
MRGRVGAVIAAAGQSKRMSGVNKVFAELGGSPLLARVLDTFQECPVVDEIVLILGEKNLERGRELVSSHRWPKITAICLGGERRQDSVKKGLQRLRDCRWVVIHDGARPLVTPDLIERGLAEARESGAAVAAVPVKDTIKRVSRDGFVQETPERDTLWAIQTPQIFLFDLIFQAHQEITEDVSDDAMMAERLGHGVKIYMGSYENIKVTTPEDLALAEVILRRKKAMRVGIGYDVHRLVEGRRLVLGGVEVPFDKGLLGWSDADVVIHAVIDALLGAAALGDIGTYFPSDDPQYSGISSLVLLRQTKELLVDHGWHISNIDVTIVAQGPTLAPFISGMKTQIAEALSIDETQVGIKAKTADGLGFVGRGEGMAAYAVALLGTNKRDD